MANTIKEDELQAKLCRIMGVFPEELEFNLPNSFGNKECSEIIDLIKQYGIEQRLDELDYIRQKGQRIVVPGMEDRPVWSDAFRERIAELTALKEQEKA